MGLFAGYLGITPRKIDIDRTGTKAHPDIDSEADNHRDNRTQRG